MTNIIRIFFESGIIGTLLFITAFISPVMKLEKETQIKNLVFFMLLMLGISFGHRTSSIFTFLGMIILVVYVLNLKKQETS